MPQVNRIWKIGGHMPLNAKVLAATVMHNGWSMEWYCKVNSLSCPRGRDWGEAHFLVSDKVLESIGQGPVDVTCEHEDGTTTRQRYYRVRFEAVSKRGDTIGCPWPIGDGCSREALRRTSDTIFVSPKLSRLNQPRTVAPRALGKKC
jgi:hypothetical protein